MLNQPLFPFTKRTFRKICLIVSRNFQHSNVLSICFGLPWMQELFWLSTSESEESWGHWSHLNSPDDILQAKLRPSDQSVTCRNIFLHRKVHQSYYLSSQWPSACAKATIAFEFLEQSGEVYWNCSQTRMGLRLVECPHLFKRAFWKKRDTDNH